MNEAVRLHKDDALDEAAPIYRRFLAQVPAHGRGWTNYGALLRKQGHFGASIAAHRRALQLEPELESAQNNLANALNDSGAYPEAITIRRELLAMDPDDPARIRDLAVSLRGDWQHEEVIALVDRAERNLDVTGQGELLLQRGLSHLMLGNYAEGFRDFEGRFDGPEVSLPAEVPFARWTGQDIAGKRLLILPEQGFGDAILMARFLPRLIGMGAEPTMLVKPPLKRLLNGLDSVAEGALTLVAEARKSDAFDFYTPNMSLPNLVGLEDNKPPPLPRLHIPEDSRKRARALVRPFDGVFKIGVVWTGSLTYRANHRRACGPEAFLPLTEIPGVQLFSLYKGQAHKEFVASGLSGLILDACSKDRDFADTAALIEEMDLMITTDTAVVHIAGSLGKPIWNLLAHEGFWLYGSGETTPWYPSMRLFRQTSPGDWAEVFARVRAELEAHLERER
ncbi:MAG: tetratricopeptide repeat-containing glycosyltransferase family protein [Pseudomonadota bacterium]